MAASPSDTSGVDAGRTDEARARAADPPPWAHVRPPLVVSPGQGTGVDSIVQEIREGLALISARELELRRCEQDFGRQYQDLKLAARQAAAEEFEQAQTRLVEQASELNAQAVDLAARRTRLNELARELRARQIELEQQRTDLVLRVEQVRQQDESLRSWHERQQLALQDRAEGVRRRRDEVKRRIERAHDDLRRQWRELESRTVVLEARAARLDQSEQELVARHADLEQRLSQGEALAAQVERDRTELAAAGARLAEERARLAEAGSALEAERQRLAPEREQTAQATLELQAEQTRVRVEGERVTRAMPELTAERARLADERRVLAEARRTLESEQARVTQEWQRITTATPELEAERARLADGRGQVEAAERGLAAERQRLARREQEFRERAAALKAQEERLNAQQAELVRQQALLEESLRRTREAERQARRRHDEAQALRAQAEAREREARQTALALEVERRSLNSERRAQRAAGGRPEGQQGQRLEQAKRLWLSAPRSCWLRSTGLASAVAVAAALAWLLGHPALHRATVELQLASTGLPAPEAMDRHRRRLHDPGLLDDQPDAAGLAAAWQAACAAGRVDVTAGADQRVLRLSVTAGDAAEAERLVRAAGQAYAQRSEGSLPGAELPPGLRDLVSRRETLEAELQTLRQQRAGDEAGLADLPEAQERAQASVEVERLDAQLGEVTKVLAEKRTELAALLSGSVPHGSVDPAEVEKRLAEDAIYQEDRQEFRAVALQYRTELAVAMLQLVDPTKAVRSALTQFAASVEEQRALDPSAEIGAVLEQCAADASRAEARFTPFAEQWQAWLGTVQNTTVQDDVVELVKHQNTVADAARRLADEAAALVAEVGQRIEGLTAAGDGGTRAVVVAAVLRGDHAVFKHALEVFQSAAGRTALAENFELDALDRKLRGLRTRLGSRREAISQQLQLEADRAAHDRHAARVEEGREEIRQLDVRREDLVTSMMAALRKSRALDDAARRRDELEAQTRQREAEIAWLEARSAELAGQIGDAGGPLSDGEHLQVGEPASESLAGARYGQAALAAAAAFAVAWLLCALMVGRAGFWAGDRR